MGHSHSGKITHDISHYFESESPIHRLRHRFNATTAFKSLSLEQVMSSDHPPFMKRNEHLQAAAAADAAAVEKAFPKLLEPERDSHNTLVHFKYAVLQAGGQPIKRFVGKRKEGGVAPTPDTTHSISPIRHFPRSAAASLLLE